MDAEQLRRWRRDGFVLIPAVAAAAELASLRATLADPLAAAGHQRRDGAGYALRDLLRRVPAVDAWARSPAASALVAAALGPAGVPISGVLLDKVASANWRLPWHQDLQVPLQARADVPGWGPWSEKDGLVHVRPPAAVAERRIALRLHLDDCPEDNAPLQVLPGSHAEGVLADAVIARWAAAVPALTITARAGDVLAMHPWLLHASAPALRARRRRVVHIEYCAAVLPAGLAWAAGDDGVHGHA